ncbi:unnamed protein product [Echinostoma caproni]|uniref:Cytochrom_C_asm domain-containing protein n=1 Tax=Echinostoma caproni TaxID=27848 RepID=A0A183AFA0_9TREM|nr:unnamed protein product [Echinostoma caproni]
MRGMWRLVLIWFTLFVSVEMVTLEEGLSDPDRYIRYDAADYNVGMHAGIVLAMLYGILSTVVLGIYITSRILGYQKKGFA